MSGRETKGSLSTRNQSWVWCGDPQEWRWGLSPTPQMWPLEHSPPGRALGAKKEPPPRNSPLPSSHPAQPPGEPFAGTAPRAPREQSEQREKRDDRTAVPLPSDFGASRSGSFIQAGEGLQSDCAGRPLVPADAQGSAAGAGRAPRQGRPAGAAITREKIRFLKAKPSLKNIKMPVKMPTFKCSLNWEFSRSRCQIGAMSLAAPLSSWRVLFLQLGSFAWKYNVLVILRGIPRAKSIDNNQSKEGTDWKC